MYHWPSQNWMDWTLWFCSFLPSNWHWLKHTNSMETLKLWANSSAKHSNMFEQRLFVTHLIAITGYDSSCGTKAKAKITRKLARFTNKQFSNTYRINGLIRFNHLFKLFLLRLYSIRMQWKSIPPPTPPYTISWKHWARDYSWIKFN